MHSQDKSALNTYVGVHLALQPLFFFLVDEFLPQ